MKSSAGEKKTFWRHSVATVVAGFSCEIAEKTRHLGRWTLDQRVRSLVGLGGTCVGSTDTGQSTTDDQHAHSTADMADHDGVYHYQKGIFQTPKNKAVKRWYKEVGLGFKTPSEAINGTYIDKKCPFTSDKVSIRGRILTGVCTSNKMNRTVVIRREYLHYIPKYNRYEKRHKNLSAHLSPAFIGVEAGDILTVGQCRPLSKTVRFNVLKVQKNVVKGAKSFSKF